MSCYDTRIERRHGTGHAGVALRTEAAILAHARHPGVADLIAIETDGGGDETWIDVAAPHGPTLGTARLPPAQLAGAVAMVATTVADLHEIGVAHCDLSVDAVRLGTDGRAVLTRFHDARWIDGPPARWRSHPLAKADDRALGRMLGAQVRLLGGPEPSLASRSRVARRRRRTGPHATPSPLDALSRLAGAAAGGQLSSRALAEALATDIEGASVPVVVSTDAQHVRDRDNIDPRAKERDDGDGTQPRHSGDGRYDAPPAPGGMEASMQMPRGVALGVGVALGLALATALVVAVHPHDQARRAAPSAASCSGTATACPPYADGILSFGSARYTVGAPGDAVAVGRWGCATARLVLLEPTSGTLWSFASWPTGATPVTPRRALALGSAYRLAVRSTRRCDRLFVTTASGKHHDVTTAVAQ